MADKPILFSGPMVRALLAGTKTQTRRFLDAWTNEPVAFMLDGRITATDENYRTYTWPRTHAVGDRLYVRETWTHTGTGVWTIADTRYARDGAVAYHADGAIPGGKYWPSIHMPKRYSRLTPTVTDVRVERLLDISEADALAEGCVMSAPVADIPPGPNPQASYLRLWDKINGDGAAALNPWVAAYSFTVERGNIDQLRAAP